VTTQPPAGWYPDPSGKPGQMYWDGQKWQPPAAAPARPAAAPTPWDQARPYVDKGRQRWSSLRPEHKVMVAIAGLLVAVALVATPVIAFNYLFGGGSGPSAGGSSGRSAAYQAGYNAGLNQATAPAGPYTNPSDYCGMLSVSQGGGDKAATQDWIDGCMAGFQKGH
jgi:hypothetical protein